MEIVQTFMFYLRRFKELRKRQILLRFVNIGLLLSGALMTYKVMIILANSESPVVVVLSGSMEPSIQRGDLLVLTNFEKGQPLVTGDIVVYKLPDRGVPIVHRIIKVHEDEDRSVDILSKGDNNISDDRVLYDPDMDWLRRDMIVGRACAFLPKAGKLTVIMNDYPLFKYLLLVGLSLFALVSG